MITEYKRSDVITDLYESFPSREAVTDAGFRSCCCKMHVCVFLQQFYKLKISQRQFVSSHCV